MDRVTVDGRIWIPRAALGETCVAEDLAALSVANPAYIEAQRRGRPVWRIPPRISALDVTNNHVAYPRGAADLARHRVRELRLSCDDRRNRCDAEPLAYRGALTAYQSDAVDALVSCSGGIATGPCGAGKGEIISALVGRLGLSALIIVHTIDLAIDLRDRIRMRLGVDVGLIGGGELTTGRITVALIQSLRDAAKLELVKGAAVLIIDEVHRHSGRTSRAILDAIPARHVYGFTATPGGALWPLVEWSVGPIVHRVTRGDVAAAGRSVEPRFDVVPTAFAYPYRGPEDWAGLLDALVRDDARNALIAETVAATLEGELGLVLTGRVEHAETIAGLLAARGLRAVVITGATPKKERVRILDEARAGALDVVVSTQLFDEGVDVPRLARVYLVFPSKAAGRNVQRVGRALRVHAEKGEARVYDFVDERVGVLRHQARTRAAIFAAEWPATGSLRGVG